MLRFGFRCEARYGHCVCLYVGVLCILAGAGAQFEAISAYVKTESVHFHYRMLTARGCAGLGLACCVVPDSVYRIQSQTESCTLSW